METAQVGRGKPAAKQKENPRLKKLSGWNGLSPFSRAVLSVVYSIPRGEVRTYSQVAKMAAKQSGRARYANAARAVGTVMAQNPYAPRVPCHRVVRSDSATGNYSGKGGKEGKMKMLKKEGVKISKNRIDPRAGGRARNMR